MRKYETQNLFPDRLWQGLVRGEGVPHKGAGEGSPPLGDIGGREEREVIKDDDETQILITLTSAFLPAASSRNRRSFVN